VNWRLLFMLCCALSVVRAWSGAPKEVLLIRVGGAAQDRIPWLLGGGTRDLPLTFLKPDRGISLVADLYLSGGALGAPLAQGIPFEEAPSGKIPSLGEGRFSLKLPAVQKPVRMLLSVREGATDSSREVTSIPFVVVPDTCWSRMAQRLAEKQSSGHTLSLAIFGEVHGLRELLRGKQVPFEDLGREFPARLAAGTVAVGDLPREQPVPSAAMEPGSSLLVFQEDEAAPQDITVTSREGKTLIVVHQPSPAAWADDAKAQQLLTDLIQDTPLKP
jgi:hypothetical protein